MTIQHLQNQVELFNQRGKELLEQFPDLNQMSWSIEGIPYAVFKEYRDTYLPEVQLTESCGRLFYISQYSYGAGVQIVFYSVPVKIKRIIEVDETETVPV